MRFRRSLGLMLALALAACAAPANPPAPTTAPSGVLDGQVYPDGNPYRLLQAEELPVVGVTVDSQTAPKERLIDGNLSTEWVNGGYRNATAWAAVELASEADLSSIGLKTGPSAAGTRYDVQVSSDGSAWTTVLSNQTNAGWGLETKALPAGTSGKFVRIFWHNSPTTPQAHFSIFELVVNGEAGAGPSPTPTPSATPTPTPTPVPTATPTPAPTGTPGGPSQTVVPTQVTANSSYSNLVPSRTIDGNQSTQWANGGYRDAEAWLALQFDQRIAFEGVSLKTGALPSGVRYRVEVSEDGAAWTAASGDLTNTTWQMESKAVNGSGRYLRIHLFNSASAPIARFSVFEMAVTGRGSSTTNQAPVIDTIAQDRLYNPNALSAEARDPDGEALTYTWRRFDGSLLGTGNPVSYTISGENVQASGHNNDEPITLTVSDGRGGTVSRTYLVDNMSGVEWQLQANEPITWAPEKAAFVPMSGTVTIQASGDFKIYAGVIIEYSTSQGRRLAIAQPGTTTLTGVTGNVFAYLLGPSDEGAALPNITLQFSNGSQSTTRTLTVANVAGYHHQGTELFLGPGDPQSLAGESDARNGANPYQEALYIQSSGYLSYSDYGLSREDGEANGLELNGTIFYRLIRYKDLFWGADHRLSYGNYGAWLGFTDSVGGAGDNTGAMTIYEPYQE